MLHARAATRMRRLAAALIALSIAIPAAMFAAAPASADDVAPPTFTVSYDANGGTGTVPAQTGVVGVTLPFDTLLSRVGYRFASWNTAADGSGTALLPTVWFVPTADTTLYAQWTAVSTITFDANGGSFGSSSGDAAQSLQGAYGFKTTAPWPPLRDGYTLSGWNTKPDGTGSMFLSETKFTVTSDITVYAQWKPILTITYNLNGGTGTPPQPARVVWNETSSSYVYTPLATPTSVRSGYFAQDSFWNTKADGSGTTYRSGYSISPDSSMTLYLMWYKPANLSWDANGGLFAASSVTATVRVVGLTQPGTSQGCYFILAGRGTPTTVQREGYTLTGFNSAKDGSGTTSCTPWRTGSFTMPASDTTMYAQWLAITSQTVTYNANGGTGTVTAQTYIDGTAATALTIAGGSTLTRPGYSFTGWNTASTGSGTAYAAASSLRPTTNVTLYAQWSANTVTITFTANGAGIELEGTTYTVGGTPAIAYDPSEDAPAGFTFTGWNTKADGTGTAYPAGSPLSPTEALTLYARWTIAAATATVTLPGGVGSPADGGTTQVQAANLQAGSSWQVVARSTPVTLGSGTVGKTGAVSFMGILPSGLGAGNHTVTFTGTAANGQPFTSVIYYQLDAAGTILRTTTSGVVAAGWPAVTTAAAPSGLAATGQGVPWQRSAILALALLASGALLRSRRGQCEAPIRQ